MFKGSSLNVSSHSNLCVRTWVATGRGHLPNKVVFCIFILCSPMLYVRASVCEVLLRNKIMSRLAGTRPSKRRNSSFLAQMVQKILKGRKMDFHINQAKRLIKSTDANPNLNADYRKTLGGNIGCRYFHASLRGPRSFYCTDGWTAVSPFWTQLVEVFGLNPADWLFHFIPPGGGHLVRVETQV